MVSPFSDKLDYLDPKEIAKCILQLDQCNDHSRCVDITFKEEK
jgi:hypothetical protein